MRIYLDGMWFRFTGIGRIYENLMAGLIDSDEVESIATIVSPQKKDLFLEKFSHPKVYPHYEEYPLDYRELLTKGMRLRNLRPRPDLYYFPSFNVPFFLEGTIVSTVCDLIPLTRYFDLPWHRRLRFRYAVAHALKRSRRVVCISGCTRDHVLGEFGIRRDLLEVIHPPLDFPPIEEETVREGGRPLVDGDYLLYVGNRNPHKNLRCFLEAFRRLHSGYPGFKAVVAGPRMRESDDVDAAKRSPELGEKIIEIQNATDKDIRNLYRSARVFVFPTLIEGFGIPPLEALWSGVPVVCSDIPVAREVCGDAVRYADPSDPEDFARSIRDALKEPRDEARRAEGKRWVLRYSLSEATRRYLDLFRRCLGRDT